MTTPPEVIAALAAHVGPDTELAEHLRATRQSVSHLRRRLDIQPAGTPVWADRALIERARRDGEDNRAVVDRALRELADTITPPTDTP
jgi:hypothetical protein